MENNIIEIIENNDIIFIENLFKNKIDEKTITPMIETSISMNHYPIFCMVVDYAIKNGLTCAILKDKLIIMILENNLIDYIVHLEGHNIMRYHLVHLNIVEYIVCKGSDTYIMINEMISRGIFNIYGTGIIIRGLLEVDNFDYLIVDSLLKVTNIFDQKYIIDNQWNFGSFSVKGYQYMIDRGLVKELNLIFVKVMDQLDINFISKIIKHFDAFLEKEIILDVMIDRTISWGDTTRNGNLFLSIVKILQEHHFQVIITEKFKKDVMPFFEFVDNLKEIMGTGDIRV